MHNASDYSQIPAVAATYKPTPDERAARQAMQARRIKTPRIKVAREETGVFMLSLDHPDRDCGYALLMNAFGTGEAAFIGELLVQLARATDDGKQPNEQRLNFFAAVIRGIKPLAAEPCGSQGRSHVTAGSSPTRRDLV